MSSVGPQSPKPHFGKHLTLPAALQVDYATGAEYDWVINKLTELCKHYGTAPVAPTPAPRCHQRLHITVSQEEASRWSGRSEAEPGSSRSAAATGPEGKRASQPAGMQRSSEPAGVDASQ